MAQIAATTGSVAVGSTIGHGLLILRHALRFSSQNPGTPSTSMYLSTSTCDVQAKGITSVCWNIHSSDSCFFLERLPNRISFGMRQLLLGVVGGCCCCAGMLVELGANNFLHVTIYTIFTSLHWFGAIKMVVLWWQVQGYCLTEKDAQNLYAQSAYNIAQWLRFARFNKTRFLCF